MDEVENERAAVVAYLKSWAADLEAEASWHARDACDAAADAISRGDHREKQR